MSVTSATILQTFEQMGLRTTRPRRLIAERLAELACSSGDFATDDLWHELQQVDPQIGRATVFRAVDLLVEQGLLDRVTFPDGSHRYRVCGAEHHHHVICTRCHRAVEVAACLPDEALAAIAAATDFTVQGHSVEIFGLCPQCQHAPSA